MNNLLKLIVPLLSSNITLNDISVESGFVDAYTFDINYPEEGCIYLMYDAQMRTNETAKRYYKFLTLPEVKTSRIIHINKKPYLLYVLKITSKGVRDLAKGLIMLDNIQKTRILQFWGFTDSFIQTVLFNNINFLKSNFNVPEEDYMPDLYETIMNKKSQGLLIESLA